jgi:hypothetical protein
MMMILLQQKYLGSGQGMVSGSIVDEYFTQPLAQNLDTVSNFVFSVIAITALIGALKVYKKMQAGDDDSSSVAFRWGAAIVVSIVRNRNDRKEPDTVPGSNDRI